MTTNSYPWHVDLEKFIALQIKATPKLIRTAKLLSKKLHKSSGHKEAHLYLKWAHKIGREKTEQWWNEHTE